MRIGLIGCGTVGSLLGSRLLRAGHELAAFDRRPEAVAPLLALGAGQAAGMADMLSVIEEVTQFDPTACATAWLVETTVPQVAACP